MTCVRESVRVDTEQSPYGFEYVNADHSQYTYRVCTHMQRVYVRLPPAAAFRSKNARLGPESGASDLPKYVDSACPWELRHDQGTNRKLSVS